MSRTEHLFQQSHSTLPPTFNEGDRREEDAVDEPRVCCQLSRTYGCAQRPSKAGARGDAVEAPVVHRGLAAEGEGTSPAPGHLHRGAGICEAPGESAGGGEAGHGGRWARERLGRGGLPGRAPTQHLPPSANTPSRITPPHRGEPGLGRALPFLY